ncbi:hypothetical protein T4B_2605 [Trichinella pseudospiralis]|uniref:Uncharacterized protein n=1 Tax=Trichinella pseudospiralis TaxID=6337 RepID=A0A0V1EYS0_TRIPS|nr:hypothetical protein T4A_6576 [Trichinella pseudospiralis]KRZ32830.1 hypothetical protein T4B_2605 [Trichinella pseudospiralis]KRZ46374.1 hypothetical protein T4C_11008 [Trichinella pseudospiralis]
MIIVKNCSMSNSVSTTEFVTSFPLRKLFCCHLKFATFQPTENSWTLLVDGTLQMRCDEKNVDKKTVIFSDSTGNVDVILPSSMKQNVSDVSAENYCSLICELVDKSDDGIVTVKAKKLTPLQFKQKSNLEIAWATEFCFLCFEKSNNEIGYEILVQNLFNKMYGVYENFGNNDQNNVEARFLHRLFFIKGSGKRTHLGATHMTKHPILVSKCAE